MASVFRSDGTYIYATLDTEFYLPNSYFDSASGFASRNGSLITTIGIFEFKCLKNGKYLEHHVMAIPSWFDIFVYESEEREITLGDGSIEKCQVISYLPGQKIMNASIVQDSDNIEKYMAFILRGKVPSIVPYEKSRELWDRNESLNGNSLGVPSVIKELILSTYYRYKKNPSKKFSHVIGKDSTGTKISQYDYVMNNVRQVCQYSSTVAGITFEDIDTMITTSVNRTRNHEEEAYSPIEKLLKL